MSGVGDCPRALSAERLGYPCEAAPDWLERAADEGKKHEIWIKEQLKTEGFTVTGEQLELSLDYPSFKLVGHIDGIIYEDNKNPKLLEIKSMSQYEFDRWMKEKWSGFQSYAAQISCYYKAINQYWSQTVDGIYYMVKNRSSGYIDKATLAEPPADFDEIIKKIEHVEECVAIGVLVETEYNTDSLQCKRCFYKTLCVPEPKVLSAVDEKTLLAACEKWRTGSLMEDEGAQLVKEAKETFRTHTEVTGQKKWRFNELTISKVEVRESVTYKKENLLKLFTEEQLKPASEIKLPYSFIKVTDLQEEK